MRCYLCKATSKDIDKMVQQPIIEEHLDFGISSLHAWIRMMECCLHPSYKLDLQK
jgi:hypothetical protein